MATPLGQNKTTQLHNRLNCSIISRRRSSLNTRHSPDQFLEHTHKSHDTPTLDALDQAHAACTSPKTCVDICIHNFDFHSAKRCHCSSHQIAGNKEAFGRTERSLARQIQAISPPSPSITKVPREPRRFQARVSQRSEERSYMKKYEKAGSVVVKGVQRWPPRLGRLVMSEIKEMRARRLDRAWFQERQDNKFKGN